MANIETTVAALAKSRILPDKPKPVGRPEPAEPTKAQIEQVVEMLSKPWKYGTFVARIERVTGLSHKVVMQIKEAFDARRAELSSDVAEEIKV